MLHHLLKGGAASIPLQLKAQRGDAKSGGISKRRRNEATWKHHNERDRPGRQGSLRLPASKGHRQAAVTASHVVARRYWWRGLWWCWRGVIGKLKEQKLVHLNAGGRNEGKEALRSGLQQRWKEAGKTPPGRKSPKSSLLQVAKLRRAPVEG